MFERRPEQNLRYPLLLIHGLFSSSRTWKKTIADFTENYDFRYGGEVSAAGGSAIVAGDFYTLNFSNNRNLSYREQALEIRAAVDAIKKINSAAKVVLAGHSMGGLAARAAVQLMGATDVLCPDHAGNSPLWQPTGALARHDACGRASRFLASRARAGGVRRRAAKKRRVSSAVF
jgi:pimeloyl-ACP methyl ester carboxylesterase